MSSNDCNILVIGNGFDLAHKFPTSYMDYIKFLRFCTDYLNQNDDYFDWLTSESKELHDCIINNQKNVANNNKILSKLVSKNFWLGYFNTIIVDGENWIDFEKEISNVVKHLEGRRNNVSIEKVENGLSKLFDSSMRHISDQAGFVRTTKYEGYYELYESENEDKFMKSIEEDLNIFIEGFEIYLRDFVMKSDFTKDLFKFEDNQFDFVISFNYTNTFEEYYKEKLNKESKFLLKPTNFDYIHGRINTSESEKCNLVLGIDEYLDHDKRSNDTRYIRFKKYFQRIYKETDCEYLTLMDIFSMSLEEINKKRVKIKNSGSEEDKKFSMLLRDVERLLENEHSYNLHIIGHSLDITDKDVLNKLITSPYVKTKIYYHDDESYAKQIENLVKVIGFEELNKRVSGFNKSIYFIPQSEIMQ